MNRAQCLRILGLSEGVGLEEVKQAYRKLAFSLHPDLNPGNPQASRDFQQLNQAYVVLTELLQKSGDTRGKKRAAPGAAGKSAEDPNESMRRQARRAYDRAKGRFGQTDSSAKSGPPPKPEPDPAKSQEEVLGDLLRDPFARRVFEDIYSQIRKDASTVRKTGRKITQRGTSSVGAMGRMVQKLSGGLMDWVRRQADEERTLYMPPAKIVPGARLRLQIQSGITDKSRVVEVSLPPGYVPGQAIRLKGLGKNIGGVKGDLYLRILPRQRVPA